jgi:hypothetical protein
MPMSLCKVENKNDINMQSRTDVVSNTTYTCLIKSELMKLSNIKIIILPEKKHLVNSYHIIPHTCNNPNTGAINAVIKCVIKTRERSRIKLQIITRGKNQKNKR